MLKDLLQFSNSALLYCAPPGAGKTTSILELISQIKDKKWLFLSPLRAIAEEFRQRLKDLDETYHCEDLACQKLGQCWVGTVESLSAFFWHSFDEKSEDYIIVLDEFHLFYEWGQDFRPKLLEAWSSLACGKASVIGLSATVKEKWLKQFELDCQGLFEQSYLLDTGNFKLLNPPREHCFPLRFPNFLIQELVLKLLSLERERVLIFCETRSQVEEWYRFCLIQGIYAGKCLGGQAKFFSEKLKKSSPQVIIATTVLSHGVNLPSVERVYILYQVDDPSFYLQMLARGGRRGENFHVYSYQMINGHKRNYNWLKDYLKAQVKYQWIKFKELFFIKPQSRKRISS